MYFVSKIKVWKLPVLLVDDFIDVTPMLLRQAYIESIYQVEHFDFRRLTQSYWDELILRTSNSQSNKYFFEQFPAFLEPTIFPFKLNSNQYNDNNDNNDNSELRFVRPKERVDCTQSDNKNRDICSFGKRDFLKECAEIIKSHCVFALLFIFLL